MILTRRAICEQIQRRLANGTPSADFEPVIDEINSWLNHGIPAAALKSYADSVQLDGVESVPDGFYVTFRKIPVSMEDGIGLFKASLPATPYGMPRGYDISAAWLMTSGRLGQSMIRIDEKHIGMYRDMPRPMNSILFWVEGATMYIDSPIDLSSKVLAIRMAAATGELDDPISMPPDYLGYLIEYVMRNFAPSVNQPQDTVNDGQNIK